MTIRRSSCAAVIVIAVLAGTTGCAHRSPGTEPSLGDSTPSPSTSSLSTPSPGASSSSSASATATAIDLMPTVWRVRGAAGEAEATWLRVDGASLQILRPKGAVNLAWSTEGNGMLALLTGWSTSVGDRPSAPWLTTAAAFDRDGDGWLLRDAAGRVTARLVRDGTPPVAKNYFTDAPVVTSWERRRLADVVPGPGVHAVRPQELVGRWGRSDVDPKDASVAFTADGAWSATTRCANGHSGAYRLLESGVLLTVGYATTLVGCQQPPQPVATVADTVTSIDSAGSVRLDGDDLVLYDRGGAPLGALHRLPASS
ncbi:hypothetical protein [uncultured Amnibacterium sp.]|uniref:hypothetical protein n=1 Tax=uncultured Amnibacterium sp. TaxID=1631851 RepID=UPI0035CB564A